MAKTKEKKQKQPSPIKTKSNANKNPPTKTKSDADKTPQNKELCLTSHLRQRAFIFLLVSPFIFLLLQPYFKAPANSEQYCDAPTDETEDHSKLRPMVYDVGSGEDTFLAYVTPDVSTFYGEKPGSRVAVQPSFNGFHGKFINLSPLHLKWFWQPPRQPGRPRPEGMFMADVHPFQSVGTATFPGHKFIFVLADEKERAVKWFHVISGKGVYIYDPLNFNSEDYAVYTGRRLGELTEEERGMYEIQRRNLVFAEQYKKYTGRDWLSRYPRPPPRHKMWRADYFGQRHWVETRETHFVTLPPESDLTPILQQGSDRRLSDDQPRLLQEFRTPEKTLNLTLTAISCAPRAFEIQNFLSEVEVNHVLYLATGLNLHRSDTYGGSGAGSHESNIRTSMNSWVKREKSPIVDAIYRRAADLFQIDEALFRHRFHEYPEWPTKLSLAEQLQLVHYEVGQEYTAHHDFVHPVVKDEHQPARFATLLLYLNDGMEGGETSFPRWRNAESGEELKVVPEKGKAVLFYNLLPDGNMDDLSQHAALPVKKGEKWLMNLWVWDPVYGA